MSEETIFREVDEELRRDRLRTAWRRFGPWVIAAAVAVVLVVAGNEGWNWWQSSSAAKSSDAFYAALDLEQKGDAAGAQKALDALIATGSGQYPTLAKFKQAGILAGQGKTDDALAAYDALSNSQIDQRLKEAAFLLAGNLLVDKGNVAGVKQRVQGLITADNPLRNSAREAIGLAQYKSGDLNGARDSFESVLADPLSTDQARGRMQLYIAQLVAQGATPPAPTPVAATGGSATDAATAAAQQAVDALAGPGPEAPPSGTAKLPDAAAANDNAPANAGVESAQPATPDSSLQLAVPNAPAAPGAAPDSAGMLPGGGVVLDGTAPTLPDATTPPAPAATAPAAPATPAPAAPAATPTATTPAPAASAAPAATTPAPATTPATGTSGQ